MSMLFEAVEPLKAILEHLGRYDEDIVDRLNHKLSLIVFCMLAITVTATQYVGETIKCWSPAQFTENWVEYVENYCWISNTYFIPMTENNILTAHQQEIVYYQWVPLVLFLQAFLFYLPNVFWVVLNRSLGLDINGIAKLLRNMDSLNTNHRDEYTKFISVHVDRAFRYTRSYRTSLGSKVKMRLADRGCFCGKRYGNFMVTVYMLTKLLYIGNALFQLYMMRHFLGTDYMYYGVDVVLDLTSKGEYAESSHFPRVTLCDFTIRALGRPQPHTVQCTLPINLFNEKIFIFVWFWLAGLLVLNCLNAIYWLWILCTSNNRRYVKNYLKIKEKEFDKARLNTFCSKYLRQDGVFMLRMIAKNTSDVYTTELSTLLYDHFSKKYEQELKKQEEV